jgi:hypothetical protein
MNKEVDIFLLRSKAVWTYKQVPTIQENVTDTFSRAQDGGSMFYGDVGVCLQVHLALIPTRPVSTFLLQWGSKNLKKKIAKAVMY